MESEINKFYQAKFGMFTCHDTLARIGGVRYAEDLIDHWIRNKEEQKYTWYLAIAFVLSEKRNYHLLEKYKKDYRESKAFKSYLRNHPDHIYEVEDILTRQECKDLFEKQDKEQLELKIKKRTNNLFQKVKFYQSDKAAGKYQAPNELKDLIAESDDKKLREMILDAVNLEFTKDIKKAVV